MRGRVRWGNVGRAVAAVAVAALVIAWPRLDGGPVEVPSGAPVPVAPTPTRDRAADASRAPPAAPEPGERARRRGRPVTQRELRAPPRGRSRRTARRPRRKERRATARPADAPGPAAPQVVAPPTPTPRAVAPRARRRRRRATVVPAPPPAATVDPAEREFGFER